MAVVAATSSRPVASTSLPACAGRLCSSCRDFQSPDSQLPVACPQSSETTPDHTVVWHEAWIRARYASNSAVDVQRAEAGWSSRCRAAKAASSGRQIALSRRRATRRFGSCMIYGLTMRQHIGGQLVEGVFDPIGASVSCSRRWQELPPCHPTSVPPWLI